MVLNEFQHIVAPSFTGSSYHVVVSNSQVIGCEDRLWNDLYCVGWGVKLYSIQSTIMLRHCSVIIGDSLLLLCSCLPGWHGAGETERRSENRCRNPQHYSLQVQWWWWWWWWWWGHGVFTLNLQTFCLFCYKRGRRWKVNGLSDVLSTYSQLWPASTVGQWRPPGPLMTQSTPSAGSDHCVFLAQLYSCAVWSAIGMILSSISLSVTLCIVALSVDVGVISCIVMFL